MIPPLGEALRPEGDDALGEKKHFPDRDVETALRRIVSVVPIGVPRKCERDLG